MQLLLHPKGHAESHKTTPLKRWSRHCRDWTHNRQLEKSKMDLALLQNLIAGAGSSSQFIGGLVVALLYVVIGLLGAIGSILIFRQIFKGRWEQIFWTSFLVVIAAFYLSFAAYFEGSTHAWQTEVVGVAVFLVCAVGGLFSRPDYRGLVMSCMGSGISSHCLSGSSLAGLSITEIPLGYGIFCATYDFMVACYLMISDTAWHESGKFDPLLLAASPVIHTHRSQSIF